MTQSSPTTSPTSATANAARLSTAQLERLAQHGWVVAPNFIDTELAVSLRNDVHSLRTAGHFNVAKIGHNGMIQDTTTPFRDIRHSETCELTKGVTLPEHSGRTKMRDALDQLRVDLQGPVVTTGPATANLCPLDTQLAELMYAWYPVGGYYRRHRDAEVDTPSAWRQYSFLLYLNDQWQPSHGGALRLHRDSGGDTLPTDELPNFVDVPPTEGTLVVFRSDLVPHEVLTTHQERSAVVGWFLSAEDPTEKSGNDKKNGSHQPTAVDATATIHPETLAALRNLRDTVPRMAQKLEPQPPADHSGMIWADTTNDWGIVMDGVPPVVPSSQASPTEPVFPDTDVRYWKKIATFTTQGKVQTLALGGQRLRQMSTADLEVSLVQPALLESVVTLDLANTDVNLQILTQILRAAPAVQQLYLGGNALGAEGLTEILPHLPSHLQVLDLRYNDLNGTTAATALQALESEKLHLEGNPLGDEGAAALSLGSRCRELYAGQCAIGPAGAAALASKLSGSVLEKLYLEGNHIGNDGADALREALNQGNHKVEKLYADNNGLSKENAIALGAAVNSATVIGDAAFYQD